MWQPVGAARGAQPKIIGQIGRVIGSLRGQGHMAIVRVEQECDLAHGPGDRFHLTKRGQIALPAIRAEIRREDLRRVVSVGTPRKLRERPRYFIDLTYLLALTRSDACGMQALWKGRRLQALWMDSLAMVLRLWSFGFGADGREQD